MLGISVYFRDLDYQYLKDCASIGVHYIFTSLHIPEEDYSNLDKELPQFLNVCHKLDLEIVTDVSPVTFEKLNIEYGDFKMLKKLGFNTLRLDYGFEHIDQVQKLSKDFKLMLNASTLNENMIDALKEIELDVKDFVVTHNFYPKTYTGLTVDDFQSKNQIFHQNQINIQAFVCGDEMKRFPLYEGLPTLEKHRDTYPFIAAVELIKKYQIQDVMIGDSKAKIETLKFIKDYMDYNILTLKVYLEEEYKNYYDQILGCRKDHSEYSVRMNTPRLKHIDVSQNTLRRKGSITIDNYLMGRYCGEVQLLMEDLPKDARVNVIGFIHPDYIDAIKYIDENTKIKFVAL